MVMLNTFLFVARFTSHRYEAERVVGHNYEVVRQIITTFFRWQYAD